MTGASPSPHEPEIGVADAPPDSPIAQRALRAYLFDVASRYHGRPPTQVEMDDALREHPAHELAPPTGVYLLATGADGVPVGSVGLLRVDDGLGEVRRLHVVASHRRRGLGRRLMLAVEDRARLMGLHAVRLDTRHDLVESQALYRSLGYRETPPHSGGPYSDLWFGKTLD